jgi:predicted transcriptional regulator
MKLVDPTDFQILKALSDGKRNTAANLAVELDQNRAYLNSRMPVLADYELVEQIGPAERSGLYEITEKGKIVSEHREEYRDEDADIERIIEAELA